VGDAAWCVCVCVRVHVHVSAVFVSMHVCVRVCTNARAVWDSATWDECGACMEPSILMDAAAHHRTQSGTHSPLTLDSKQQAH